MEPRHGEAQRLLPGRDVAKQNALVAAEDESLILREKTVRENTFAGPGRFGRMFPNLAPFQPPDAALIALGQGMGDRDFIGNDAHAIDDPAGDNPNVPAGFTYFGQFVDHDITFDKTAGFPPVEDPESARTPTLDLDSLYGMGPDLQPELYDQTGRLLIGHTNFDLDPFHRVQAVNLPFDLPRKDSISSSEAILGDPRNDENLIVAQTHLLFLYFHNRLMDILPDADQNDGRSKFERAQETVRRHYQWLVLHDYLGRILEPGSVEDVLQYGRKFYRFEEYPEKLPFMPLEFSVAAYRLGHSMVRQAYDYNRVFRHRLPSDDAPGVPEDITPVTTAILPLLFRFTGRHNAQGQPFPGTGTAPIPTNWIIDWRRFFEVDGTGKITPNAARKFDTKLCEPLARLPEFADVTEPELRSLAVRNLLRGSRRGLPSGQDVAAAMGIAPLTPDELLSGDDHEVIKNNGFEKSTPLWYYVLKEAEVRQRALCLGSVGSRLVAEVFVGLLQADPGSYLNAPSGPWRPWLPAAVQGTFTMVDLVRFVGNINPIGERFTDTMLF